MKTLLSFLIMPFTFSVLVVLAGLVIRMFWHRRRGGFVMITGGVLLLFFSSFPGSWLLLYPLERMYDPLLDPAASPAPYIVVLGGGYNSDGSLPATTRLGTSSSMRLNEGLRIRDVLPEATLIVSGGSKTRSGSTAEAFREAMIDLGRDTSNVVLHSEAANTEQEARAVRDRVGSGPVILVTSARHMPRSAALFRGAGIEVIPAPAAHEIPRGEPLRFDHFVWSPNYLRHSHMAFHEYYGLAWAWLRGRL